MRDHDLRNANGAIVNNYGIGHALLSLPFFLLDFPLTFLARLFGLPWDYDGMNPLSQFHDEAVANGDPPLLLPAALPPGGRIGSRNAH